MSRLKLISSNVVVEPSPLTYRVLVIKDKDVPGYNRYLVTHRGLEHSGWSSYTLALGVCRDLNRNARLNQKRIS